MNPVASHQDWKPSHNPWAVALTVTMATFMEVLDSSIANVSLPHIAGSLGATYDEAVWVLTSYLVSAAIVLPASGWLSTVFGRKRFYMTCVVLFTVSSFLCGIAPNLPMLIIARVLQGAGRRRTAAFRASHPGRYISHRKARHGFRRLRHGRCAGARHRSHAGRMDYRQLQLALDLFHQPAGGPDVAVLYQPPGGRSALAERRETRRHQGRLHRARPDGHRHRLLPIRARQRPGVGLVFFAADYGGWPASAFRCWPHSSSGSGITPIPLWTCACSKTAISERRLFFRSSWEWCLFGSTVLIPEFLQTSLGYTAELAGLALSPAGFVLMVMMTMAGRLTGLENRSAPADLLLASWALPWRCGS